jgi:hypothetical protein
MQEVRRFKPSTVSRRIGRLLRRSAMPDKVP